MADTGDYDNLDYRMEILGELMNKVFAHETRKLSGFKNPLLNPLRTTFEEFAQNPIPTNFEPFKQALENCKEADNNKVKAHNFAEIIQASQDCMSRYQNESSNNKKPKF